MTTAPPAATSLQVTVSPERGGKIVSLRDGRGTEWLSQTHNRAVQPGSSFGSAEMAGWDECVPTVTACEVDGAPIPDHGDVWDVPWDGTPESLVITGRSLPYRLTRRMSVEGARMTLAYSARSLAAAIPFLWTAHPQFDAPPGTTLQLSPQPSRMVDVLHESHRELSWSAEEASIDTLEPGDCRKLYVHPSERVDSATLIRPDGGRLRMTWSKTVPYLGLWFDRAAYAPTDVIALEPSLSFADSLALAADNGTAPRLTGTVDLEWWLSVEVLTELSPFAATDTARGSSHGRVGTDAKSTAGLDTRQRH